MWELGDGLGDLGDETRDVKKKLADMVMEMDNIPTEKKTKLLTMIDRGAIDEVYAELGKLQRYVITIPVRPVGSGMSTIGGGGKRANGGPVTAGAPYLVGERGPELIVPAANAMVLDASRTERAMSGNATPANVTINVMSSDPRAVVEAVKKYLGKGGQL